MALVVLVLILLFVFFVTFCAFLYLGVVFLEGIDDFYRRRRRTYRQSNAAPSQPI
jgi:hypothetical protein